MPRWGGHEGMMGGHDGMMGEHHGTMGGMMGGRPGMMGPGGAPPADVPPGPCRDASEGRGRPGPVPLPARLPGVLHRPAPPPAGQRLGRPHSPGGPALPCTERGLVSAAVCGWSGLMVARKGPGVIGAAGAGGGQPVLRGGPDAARPQRHRLSHSALCAACLAGPLPGPRSRSRALPRGVGAAGVVPRGPGGLAKLRPKLRPKLRASGPGRVGPGRLRAA